MNLLQETLTALFNSGHKISDIVFIGSEESGHSCTWTEFEKMADREYDSGFGGAEVATDLIIVFRDGQKMWRGENDGSEWWEYSTPFKQPKILKPIKNLFGKYHQPLTDINLPSIQWTARELAILDELGTLTDEPNQADIDAAAADALRAAVERGETYDNVMAIIENGRKWTGG